MSLLSSGLIGAEKILYMSLWFLFNGMSLEIFINQDLVISH